MVGDRRTPFGGNAFKGLAYSGFDFTVGFTVVTSFPAGCRAVSAAVFAGGTPALTVFVSGGVSAEVT